MGVVGASTIGTENNEKSIYSIFWYISQVLTEIIHELQYADNLKFLSYIIFFSVLVGLFSRLECNWMILQFVVGSKLHLYARTSCDSFSFNLTYAIKSKFNLTLISKFGSVSEEIHKHY